MSFIGFEMEITASVTFLYFNNISNWSVAAFAWIKESFRSRDYSCNWDYVRQLYKVDSAATCLQTKFASKITQF